MSCFAASLTARAVEHVVAPASRRAAAHAAAAGCKPAVVGAAAATTRSLDPFQQAAATLVPKSVALRVMQLRNL
jgi:hypothetical protein